MVATTGVSTMLCLAVFAAAAAKKRRPNIIVIQPDDLPFYDAWTRSPNAPTSPTKSVPFPNHPVFSMPNVERLRTQGVEMTQSYAASPSCGTSRYSTLTGKYPSRSSFSRLIRNAGETLSDVTIPTTKLIDLGSEGNDDCSKENLAAVLKSNGYRTGVVGKWHLDLVDHDAYDYRSAVDRIKSCGFDFAEGIYVENLKTAITGDKASHNMEWITSEAIRFINGEYEGSDCHGEEGSGVPGRRAAAAAARTKQRTGTRAKTRTNDRTKRRRKRIRKFTRNFGTTADNTDENATIDEASDQAGTPCENLPDVGVDDDERQPFFLYFNPTAPHGSMNVLEALTDFDCKRTADVSNPLPSDPLIKGMTLAYGSCESYRRSVLQRAGTKATSNADFGTVWLDDSMGALIQALMDADEWEDTVIVFQMDHGIETKAALYENGLRIAQFVHWPNGFGTEGRRFDGLASTADVAPTLMEMAEVVMSDAYGMDGESWLRGIVGDGEENVALEEKWKNERCLWFEFEKDRALRCGCQKYVKLNDAATSTTAKKGKKGNYPYEVEMMFDLCDDDGEYVVHDASSPVVNPEGTNILDQVDQRDLSVYREVFECFLAATTPESAPINYDAAAECTTKLYLSG